MHIVAIGGGEIRDHETLEIDRYIVESTGKSRPRLLFIPTASRDAPGYCETVARVYGQALGCEVEHLRLISHPEERSAAAEKIGRADAIYVGGGNTLRMMRLWNRLGLGPMLRAAGERGCVLSGLSAGAICWHEFGNSDSLPMSQRFGLPHIRVAGLGFVPGLYCPHLDSEERHASLARMVKWRGPAGVACDDCVAIDYKDGVATVLRTRDGANAYRYSRSGAREVIKGFTY